MRVHCGGTGYDAVDGTGTLGGSDAVFRIILPSSSPSFGDAFWTIDRSWSDNFLTVGGNLESVFSVA